MWGWLDTALTQLQLSWDRDVNVPVVADADAVARAATMDCPLTQLPGQHPCAVTHLCPDKTMGKWKVGLWLSDMVSMIEQ